MDGRLYVTVLTVTRLLEGPGDGPVRLGELCGMRCRLGGGRIRAANIELRSLVASLFVF